MTQRADLTLPENCDAFLHDLLGSIGAPDRDAMAAAVARQADLTKPAGSLGALEAAATTVCGLTGTLAPDVSRAAVAVFAADHGVVQQDVSAWPQSVTAAMFGAVVSGQAAVNVFARSVGASVVAVDVGIAGDVPPVDPADGVGVVAHRLGEGTKDFTSGPAMTRDDALAGIAVGAIVANNLINSGATVVCAGDLGIGNTTSSAALIAALTGVRPDMVTGMGAGLPVDRRDHKIAVVSAGLEQIQRSVEIGTTPDAVDVLAAVGGFEHAAMTGFYLAAAARSTPVILDGVISCAAAVAAAKLSSNAHYSFIAGHASPEPGAVAALGYLGLSPLIGAGMRLGEGTGAVLAIPLVQAACATMSGMATFSGLGLTVGAGSTTT